LAGSSTLDACLPPDLVLKRSFQWQNSTVTQAAPAPSARKTELLELAYSYALANGMGDLSLRPLAVAIGSSPRVLLFLFGSKDGLIRALLARARADELAMLDALRRDHPDTDLTGAAIQVWRWLSESRHRNLLTMWVEAYGQSLVQPDGPWGEFARQTVNDWLEVLAQYQLPRTRSTPTGAAHRTAALAVLRGAVLDLLATNDQQRTTAAVRLQLKAMAASPPRTTTARTTPKGRAHP
jgi:AcrR family transcriptional regulator